MTKRFLTLTTINSPNESLRRLAEGALQVGMSFVIAGDTKTPSDFQLPGCRFLTVEEQCRQFPRLGSVLPARHYARKNFAYLAAIRDGATVIQETDDDNIPRPSFFAEALESMDAVRIKSATPWFNVYAEFSDTGIWPRGLPLEYVKNSSTASSRTSGKVRCLITQGLADDNPDVDAVYRLVRPLPVTFNQSSAVFLDPGTWCPFNSQNTTFARQVFPLLYLPSKCSFRMTDIWRSFIAQRCLWELGEGVLFHSATVWQERNEHNLLKDFEDEIPGYLANERIRVLLDGMSLNTKDCRENQISCYEVLIQAGLLPREELAILHAWCDEFDRF